MFKSNAPITDITEFTSNQGTFIFVSCGKYVCRTSNKQGIQMIGAKYNIELNPKVTHMSHYAALHESSRKWLDIIHVRLVGGATLYPIYNNKLEPVDYIAYPNLSVASFQTALGFTNCHVYKVHDELNSYMQGQTALKVANVIAKIKTVNNVITFSRIEFIEFMHQCREFNVTEWNCLINHYKRYEPE